MAKQTTVATSRGVDTRSTGTRKPAPSNRKVRVDEPQIQWGIPMAKQNVLVLALGLVVVIIGYLLMSSAISKDTANNLGIWNNDNAVVFAPILLVIGYCVIIPFAIMKRFRKDVDVESRR